MFNFLKRSAVVCGSLRCQHGALSCQHGHLRQAAVVSAAEDRAATTFCEKGVLARDSICAERAICYRQFVRLSVCHSGGSIKNE